MKIWRIATVTNINGYTYINKEDYDSNFWGHSYAIDIGAYGTMHFIVNAGCEQEAFDTLIDYMEEKMPQQLFSTDDEPTEEVLGDYISGGNHGKIISTPSSEIHIAEIEYEIKYMELKSANLKAEAIEACQSRDHDMLKWEDDRTPNRIISTTKCKICDKYVQVNTNPLPNEIDISGDALALNCKPQYETATPEEIEREIGIV